MIICDLMVQPCDLRRVVQRLTDLIQNPADDLREFRLSADSILNSLEMCHLPRQHINTVHGRVLCDLNILRAQLSAIIRLQANDPATIQLAQQYINEGLQMAQNCKLGYAHLNPSSHKRRDEFEARPLLKLNNWQLFLRDCLDRTSVKGRETWNIVNIVAPQLPEVEITHIAMHVCELRNENIRMINQRRLNDGLPTKVGGLNTQNILDAITGAINDGLRQENEIFSNLHHYLPPAVVEQAIGKDHARYLPVRQVRAPPILPPQPYQASPPAPPYRPPPPAEVPIVDDQGGWEIGGLESWGDLPSQPKAKRQLSNRDFSLMIGERLKQKGLDPMHLTMDGMRQKVEIIKEIKKEFDII